MKRLFLVALVALVVAAPAACAQEPLRFPITVLPFFTAGCGYFLGVTVVTENRVVTTYSDGRQTVTGNLVLRVTHLDGGPSIVVDASGPLFSGMNGITSTGNSLWVIDDVVYFVRGQATLAFNPDGTSTFSHTGTIENLCDTLR